MLDGLNFFDYVIILSGFALCLKRVADMERYHHLRVFVLTVILGVIVIIFVEYFVATFLYYSPPPCDYHTHFCITEMSSFN